VNHRDAWDLVPWFVNGTLGAAEHAALERHLDECADCRGEVHSQRELLQAMRAQPQVEAMPRASLQRLWDRIDAQALPDQADAAPSAPTRPAAPRWIGAAAAGIVLALGATLVLLGPWRAEPAGQYRTVSDQAAVAPEGSIRAVFAGELTLSELQLLLQEARLRAVSGPTSSGVYTLAPASGSDTRAALEVLRAHPGVRFAEPVAR
jgi:hypothetical protein